MSDAAATAPCAHCSQLRIERDVAMELARLFHCEVLAVTWRYDEKTIAQIKRDNARQSAGAKRPCSGDSAENAQTAAAAANRRQAALDPLWRVRELAGLDPLSAESFRIRAMPLQRGERRLIELQFEMMQLRLMLDELTAAAGGGHDV